MALEARSVGSIRLRGDFHTIRPNSRQFTDVRARPDGGDKGRGWGAFRAGRAGRTGSPAHRRTRPLRAPSPDALRTRRGRDGAKPRHPSAHPDEAPRCRGAPRPRRPPGRRAASAPGGAARAHVTMTRSVSSPRFTPSSMGPYWLTRYSVTRAPRVRRLKCALRDTSGSKVHVMCPTSRANAHARWCCLSTRPSPRL